MTTKASKRFQILPGLNSLCRQQSSQPSKSASFNSGITLATGKLLNGRYQIMQVLGNGGFSQAYLAKDIHKPSHPTCVVKHFKPASSDPSFLQTAQQLFYTEATTLEKLGHHNQIPQLLGYLEEDQAFYLVQEYIDGQLLSTEMPLGYCWSESQVIPLLQEVLELLVFIHSHGVIHRDIKPQNLIRRSQDNKVVLIDFGTIKQIRTQTVSSQGHRSATTPMGTQGYIAPEQGQGHPRPNSDLYALGITSIQALTGLDPLRFQQDPDTGEISWQQQAEVSPELASFISKMVTYHFKDRYQSATEALEALQLLASVQSVNLTRHLLNQLETSTQQVPTPSTLMPQFPATEPSETASFSINPPEQAADSKNRRWIWNGIGTGLGSAVLLSTVIPLIPDKPPEEQSASKLGSQMQHDAKSSHSEKKAPAKKAATPKAPSPSSTQKGEELHAASIRPSSRVPKVSPPQAESMLVREAYSDFPREKTKLIAATANSPAKQTQPTLSRSNPPIHQLGVSPNATSTQNSDHYVREAQGKNPESRVAKSRTELKGDLAELKAEFSKLAEAIVLTEKALDKAEEATKQKETIDNLKGAIAQLQRNVEMLPSSKTPTPVETAPSTNSSDPKLVASLNTEVMPAEKLAEKTALIKEPEVALTTTEQLEEATSGEKEEAALDNSSTEEPELSPGTSSDEVSESSSGVGVVPTEKPEGASTAEPEMISVPVSESVSVATPEEQPEEKTPVNPLTGESSPKAVPEEQPESSEELLAEQNAHSSDLSTEQAEEAVSEEPLEGEIAPESSLTQESESTSEAISTEELEVTPDLEAVSEEQLESKIPDKTPVMSPDGQILAGISTDSTIKIWNIDTGELVSTLKGHSDIQSITISSDSQTLTSVSADDTIETWHLPTGELVETSTDRSYPA